MKTGLWCAMAAALLGAFWAAAEDKAVTPACGKIIGKALWEGEIPERKKLEVNKDNEKCECDAKSGAKQAFKLDETLVVDPGTRGVAHCVAWLKGAKGGPVLGPVEIDQKGCVFTPHVALLTVGQKLKVLNPDGIAHNFHWWSKENPADNKTIAKFKKSLEVPEAGFAKPEFIRITCDIHLWMGSWVAILENGYADGSDEKGAFQIAGMPPGKYTLALWHEPLTKDGAPILLEKEVTVEAGKAAEVSFTLSAPKK